MPGRSPRRPKLTITPAGFFRDYYATAYQQSEHDRGLSWSAMLWKGTRSSAS